MATLDLQVAADLDSVVRSEDGVDDRVFTTLAIMIGANAAGDTAYSLGARFTGVAIPKGAKITAAYLTITVRQTDTETILSDLFGEDADDAAQFDLTIADFNAPNRPRTTATAAYDGVKAWVQDTEEQLTDMTAVVQEIVDRSGWSSGNAMVFFWEDGGSVAGENQLGYFHADDSAKAPKLHIEYSLSYPLEAITRVTGIIHRYIRRKGIYQIEATLGDVSSALALPYSQFPLPGIDDAITSDPRKKLLGIGEDAITRDPRLPGLDDAFPIDPRKIIQSIPFDEL